VVHLRIAAAVAYLVVGLLVVLVLTPCACDFPRYLVVPVTGLCLILAVFVDSSVRLLTLLLDPHGTLTHCWLDA